MSIVACPGYLRKRLAVRSDPVNLILLNALHRRHAVSQIASAQPQPSIS